MVNLWFVAQVVKEANEELEKENEKQTQEIEPVKESNHDQNYKSE